MSKGKAGGAMAHAAIDVRELRKAYGTLEVLKGLTLSIERGTVYGVLGPNGAGKTTLVSILATLLRPDAGTVRVFGLDVVREADAVRSRIGLTGQFAAVDEELSGRENLALFGRLAGYSARSAKTRAEELLDAFGLLEAAGRSVDLFGGAISGSTGHYLQFLLPGMMVYTVTTMTVYIGIAMKTDMERGVFNRFRTLPFWQPAAIVGTLVIHLLSFAAAILTTFGIGLLLGFKPEAGWGGAALAFLLVMFYAFCLSWIFACVSMVVQKTESLTTMSYLVLYPIMFTSNVFADTSTMPKWLGRVVDYNPVSLASASARGLMHGTTAPSGLITTLVGLLLIVTVFMPLTFWLYRKKVKE